jgi:hypothetical protein
LLDAGVVVEERSGAGRRLVVRNAAALEEFARSRYPDVTTSLDASSRVVGVARFRDSKSFPADTPEIVSVRAWSETVLFMDGQPTEAMAATARHGVFSFLLSGAGQYELRGKCALVENPAVFGNFEQLRLPVRLVIYGQGRVSARLLRWLAAGKHLELLHLPDYDPAGLAEFERLKLHLGSRVRLHVPADLDHRFSRFSNPALLQKPNSRTLLANLRRSVIPEVHAVVELMDRYNAGLEQEALLLS